MNVPRRRPGRRLFRFPWRTAAQVAADVDEELQLHLDLVAQELVEEGWLPEAARVEAHRRFGDLDGTRKYCCALDRSKERQMRWKQMLEAFGQDFRFAGRQLAKSPGFTLIVVLTLALAVGATTSIFSVVHGVLLQPLPFAEPDRLARVFPVEEGEKGSFSAPNFLDWSKASRTVSAAAAYTSSSLNLSGDSGEPERLEAMQVGSRFFSILGVRPVAGRWFSANEDQEGAAKVAVISEELWRRRFGGDAGVIGKSINLDNEPYTVVGIVAREDQYLAGADVWIPLVFPEWALSSRGGVWLSAIARLAPGVTLEQAQLEAKTIAARLEKQYPDSNTGQSMSLSPLQEQMVGDVRTPLLVLMGAVASVLLIACVNVANLLLVRASSREGEVAIRTALGAGRGRIVRQLLTESLVLALVGGAAGVGLAVWLTRGLVSLAPQETPRLEEVGLDASVLFFALGITLVTGLLFGLAPAFQASRPDLTVALKEVARGSRGHAATRARNVLVVAEIALAVVLLAGAGLLLRSFARLQEVELGFQPDKVVTFNLSLPSSQFGEDDGPRLRAFAVSLQERMRQLPGVTSAGVAAYAMPLGDMTFSLSFDVEGRSPKPPGEKDSMRIGFVAPDFLRTLGVPVLRGRGLTEHDREGAPQVVLLNETAARRFFPGEDPLGKRILLGWSEDGVPKGGEVVGIVGDFKQRALDREVDPELFLPFLQNPMDTLAIVMRTTADPAAVAGAARAAVRQIDPTLPLYDLQTLEDVVAASASQPKFYLLLLGGFAAIALVLAAVGIYGVIAYSVRQRTQEIGIRMALGATRRRVLQMVVRQGLVLALVGAVAGLAGALFATRGMRSLLYQVSASDPPVYGAVAVVLVLVAALASYLPARRAARTEPQLALRGEV